MDSLHFDPYLSYSDAPRTPSPHDVHFIQDPHYKQPLDLEPRIYDGANDDDVPVYHQSFYNSRGSLLQELYDHDLAEQQQQQQQPHYVEPQPQQWVPQQQYHMVRRATFPYVRHDRDDNMSMPQYPPFIQHHDQFPPRSDYPEPINEHLEFHQPYHEFDENPSIKLEDTGSLMVPSQPGFYPRPPSSGSCHPMSMNYLSPHTGLPVQHTDDAASKETQYLRRRCFNCHTTEPPSWRRSTLNPGKIVCNKCGLYERTHLRPRPLRFDELRAGNKARTNKTKGTVSPKAKLTHVKKEPREFGLVRRSSVSSSSSVHSGSGASDWDDNGSGSAPPTSYNSPNTNTFPLDRDSQSPPLDGGIRLPTAPLSDLALSPAQQPRKSNTLPFYSPPGSAGNGAASQDYYRRNSISSISEGGETTGWQAVSINGPVPMTASPQLTTVDIADLSDAPVVEVKGETLPLA
ncbi:hypothetical protein C0991_008433 [Blastosporella zonata]|nr:hypothetical protein C0991_008433 [Blastosporella zonata]